MSEKTKLVFLVGPSGSGKTAVGEMLSKSTDCQVYDMDSLIECREGMLIKDIFEQRGEACFRKLEYAMIEEIINSGKNGVVATGGGTPTIKGAMAKLRSAGTSVYLRASIDTLWNRLSMDPEQLEARPLLYRRGRAALEEMVEAREPIYRSADIVIETDGLDIPSIVSEVLRVVG